MPLGGLKRVVAPQQSGSNVIEVRMRERVSPIERASERERERESESDCERQGERVSEQGRESEREIERKLYVCL